MDSSFLKSRLKSAILDDVSSKTFGVTKIINSRLSLEDCFDLKRPPNKGKSPSNGYL